MMGSAIQQFKKKKKKKPNSVGKIRTVLTTGTLFYFRGSYSISNETFKRDIENTSII